MWDQNWLLDKTILWHSLELTNRGNLSDAIFSSRAADAIASGINADRAGLKEVILKNMTDKEYSPWPLSAALSDAITYHSRCNAISGLAFLQGTAEAKKAQSEKTAPPPPAK